MYSKTLRADQAVFNAYQSASNEEVNKPKNAILHWLVVAVVFLAVAGGLFKTALAMISNKSKPKTANRLTNLPAPAAVAPGQTAPAPPVAAAIQKPFSTVQQVPVWREYPVEAYINYLGRSYYMIQGNFVDSVRCRNYSSRLKTVEYFSMEKLTASRAISGVPSASIVTGEESSRKGEAIAEPPSPLVWHREPQPEYKSRSNLDFTP